jgi:hypothetical protein
MGVRSDSARLVEVFSGPLGSDSANRIVKATDMLGHGISALHPGFGGATLETTASYDRYGRRISVRDGVDGAARPFLCAHMVYDKLGDEVLSVLDADCDGETDRTRDLMVSNAVDFIRIDGSVWLRRRKWSAQEFGSADMTLMETKKTRLTGLRD